MADQQPQIRFQDGSSYEQMMGVWSRIAGEVFLDWLAPPSGLGWIDVGCGSGAFAELLIDRCAPSSVLGIDPSEAQLSFARQRRTAGMAHFQQGDAMALPLADASCDAAVMALVIFFVPEPATGVAEMVRVMRPDGLVAAYAWDMDGGGFPYDPMLSEMRKLGLNPGTPPRSEAARLDNLATLWTGAGLAQVETRTITVERRFDDFEQYWQLGLTLPSYQAALDRLPAEDFARLKANVRARVASEEGRDGLCTRREPMP